MVRTRIGLLGPFALLALETLLCIDASLVTLLIENRAVMAWTWPSVTSALP